MDKSILTLPSRNGLSEGVRPEFIPGTNEAANISSINLNRGILPKQPVPDLKDTVQRYLRSVKPLLSEAEYLETERKIKEFEKGVGAELQRKLLKRSEYLVNYVGEWLVEAAYMSKSSVVIGFSPGTVSPSQKFSCPEEVFRFAGKLIAAVCEYDSMIKSGKIKQQMAGKDPLDMYQHTIMLGTHRRPNIPYDYLLHTDTSEHIIVVHNNEFFKLNVFDDSGKLRIPLSANKLAASLEELAGRSAVTGIPIGILTGNDRDSWAKDHQKLEACGDNKKIIKDIENALFTLSLDKALPQDLYKDKNYESIGAMQSLTGISCDINAGNRWHDKIVKYIVSYDGFVGMTYEHSPCEGVPIANLHDHVLKYIENIKEEECYKPKDFPKAEHLKFEIPEGIEDSISAAAHLVDELSRKIDMECFAFENFGANEIKKNKMSPDSFIQMALQLAYWKVHKREPCQIEGAALRRFRNARLELIRSTCTESIEFAHLMLSDVSKERKKEAMLKAIDAHKKLAIEATTGQGITRHLFCLKTVAAKEGLSSLELFTDSGYTKSAHFTVASSQVPYESASFMCYGPWAPDGYSCCYNPRPQDIRVACSSFNACEETCTKKFAEALKESFCEMMEIASRS